MRKMLRERKEKRRRKRRKRRRRGRRGTKMTTRFKLSNLVHLRLSKNSTSSMRTTTMCGLTKMKWRIICSITTMIWPKMK